MGTGQQPAVVRDECPQDRIVDNPSIVGQAAIDRWGGYSHESGESASPVKKPGLGAGLTLREAGDFDETGDFRSPFLSAIPIVNVLARLILCNAVTFLYFAFQLLPMAVS
jgi:hypothetical protein